MAKLTTEDAIARARFSLIRDDRFVALAGLMTLGTVRVKDGPGTAATNGKDEIYYRQFVDALPTKQLMFLCAHELYHKLLQHRFVWKRIAKEDHPTANMAMDYVINGMLDNHAGPASGNPLIEFIPGGCLDHRFDGMDTLQVFNILKREGAGGTGGSGPTDSHEFDDGDDFEPMSEEQAQELGKMIDTAVRQGMQMVGRTGASADRALSQMLDPQVPWEDTLREFVTTHAAGKDLSTWAKPARRWISRDLYLPTSYSETCKSIVVGVDTSGSIGPAELQRFLTEVTAACLTASPETVHLIYWDTAVAAHEVYSGEAVQTIASSTKPKGGGGTAPSCMSAYLQKRGIEADVVIQFTDGYVGNDWGGTWPAPVLWCITERSIRAANGTTLHVTV